MQDLSFWERFLLAVRFSDSLGHNIFLSILFLLTSLFVLSILSGLVKRITNGPTSGKHFKVSAGLALGFWLMVFPWGLFLVITISLNDASDASAMDAAFIYELNGRPVATTVVEKCNAHSIENGVVYANSFYKIQALDLESGKLVFDRKLNVAGTSDAKILCTTRERLFFFFDNRIVVIDKRTGGLVREIKAATQSGDVLLLRSPELCKYDPLAKGIIFKADNGLVYGLDTNRLTISEKRNLDAAEYFKTDWPEKRIERLGKGMTLALADRENYYLFLSDADLKNLKAGTEIAASSQNNERRFLYRGNLDNLAGLRKVSSDVFLTGGFLMNQNPTESPIYQKMAPQNPNYRNYVNLSIRGEPQGTLFRVKGSNLAFIVHQKNLSRPSLQLTAIDLQEGKTPWTIDTGAREIHGCYPVGRDHLLLFCENSGGTGNRNTNSILYVAIKDGTYTGFDFKYSRGFRFSEN